MKISKTGFVKKKTASRKISRLTKKISKTTGIKLSKRIKNKSKKTKTGRGGPTILDSLSLESPQVLLGSGKLRQFLYKNSYDLYKSILVFAKI